MADKIFFASAKGGAGATTVAAGVGFALALAGERTLIVDGDNVSGCALTVCGCRGLQVFTVEDFKTVIDKKSLEWMGTEREKYLRPQTLFGTKFESYLNQNIL